MGGVYVWAFAAALNPVLLGATTVMLLLDHPKRLLLGYLLGAMMTSLTLGLVIVFAVEGSSGATSTAQNTLSPAADLALGGILLVVAYMIRPGRAPREEGRMADRRRRRQEAKKEKGPPRWETALSKGTARTTFVVGALLTLPGASYLIGLNHIADQNASTAGTIALDAAFSPIQRVSYNVEPARLGKITDYEKLTLEVWTNGAVSPDEALTRAATHMRDQFALLAPEGGEEEEEEAEGAGEGSLQDSLAKTLDDLPLPARAINALKNSEILLVADLVQKTDADLEQVKNLGDKSIEEIKTALAALGLSLGMRIDPNLLGTLGRGGVK